MVTSIREKDKQGMADVLEHEGLSKPSSIKGRIQRMALKKMQDKDAAGEIPTSIRFVFYELEQAGELSKRVLKLDGSEGKRKPTQDLTDALTHLRELGLVPWDWIVDESRSVDAWPYADSVADYLEQTVELATIDRFPGVPRPVILCEARGVAGVLSRGIARDYCVTVAPTGGQSNGFLRTEVAPYLRGDVLPLYIGDHDLAGNHIEANTRCVLERAVGHPLPTWERLMLTDEQCRQLQRRGIEPIQKEDHRYKDGRPHEAYEVEALGQSLVTQIVRDRLEELAPIPLADVLEREIAQRAAIIKILNRGKK
jgi:hypothetical protein